FFIALSEFIRAYSGWLSATAVAILISALVGARHPRFSAVMRARFLRLPLIRPLFLCHRTALFCRNLDTLLTAGVTLPNALRILADTMAAMGDTAAWRQLVERVRQ